MMRRRVSFILLLTIIAAGLAAQQPDLSVNVRAQIVVMDPEASARDLSAWAESNGGYYLVRSKDRVVLRVAAARVEELRRLLVERSEAVLSYTPSAVDLREEKTRVESGITSREESLALVLQYLDEADVTATLALEKELASLVQAIEQLKGRRSRLAYDASYARVEVLLRSQAQTVPQKRPSSFPWINTVDLYRFLEDANDHNRPFAIIAVVALAAALASCVTPGPAMARPDGFALFEGEPFRAVSPEGVRLGVRVVPNEPPQTLAFWAEALKVHLQGSGYRLLLEDGFQAPLGNGRLFEWVAPVGGEDWVYLTAIAVRGAEVALVEAAGPFRFYKEHRSALLRSLSSLEPAK